MYENGDFYKNIIDNLYDGVCFVDRERVITYWNKSAERITGYASQQVIGLPCRGHPLNHVFADGVPLCSSQCPLAACLEDGGVREADIFLHHADGHRVPVLVRAAPLRDAQGNIVGAVETFTCEMGAMTMRRKLRELRRSAQTDVLTGIGNRAFIEGRLHTAIAELGHTTGATAGLLFIDIDHFKQFNDTYGHDVGDTVLRMVANTLKNKLRQSDVVGRWGGDEFLAILYDVSTLEVLKSVSEKLRTLVESAHLDLDVGSLAVTISVGGTLLLATDPPEAVVRRADDLMYQSKHAGRNRVSVG